MRTPLLALILCACGDPSPGSKGVADSGGAATEGDGADGTADGADGGTADGADGSDGGTDGTDGTEPEPPADIVRFVAMGDGGEGNADQYAVASAVAAVCAAKVSTETDGERAGCDFVLYLGDNFYDSGVDSVDDDQFQDKFELPYADLDLPFYVVLGNHDYGSTSLEFWKSDFEVQYSDRSDKWNLPSEYYTFTDTHAQFFGLDTNALMLESLWGDSGQAAWMRDELAVSTTTWRIAFGHHPYVSNGQHGNAGEYEGYDWLPIANGATVKSFMDASLCGQVDLYLAGHDHNRQWLEPSCGTEFIVSGAAAKTTDLEGRGSATLFEDDTREGFVWIELRDDVLLGEFYDKIGDLDYTREIVKPAAAAPGLAWGE
jgi:hypothetical protein